jgi:hypothetical protein
LRLKLIVDEKEVEDLSGNPGVFGNADYSGHTFYVEYHGYLMTHWLLKRIVEKNS